MSEQEKKPISEARRQHLEKARAAAAEKRRTQGMTEKQKLAVEKMQAGRREANARRKAVKAGEINAPVSNINDLEITPAKWPAKPVQKLDPVYPVTNLSNVVTTVSETQEPKQIENENGETWAQRLKRATGM